MKQSTKNSNQNKIKQLIALTIIFLMQLMLLTQISLNQNKMIYAKASQTQIIYGQIKNDATLFNVELKPICSLPNTYFVIIQSEMIDDYYPVTYSNLTGLMHKSNIEIVDFEPKYKFHSSLFKAKNDTFPTNVRSQPNSQSTVLASIPLDQTATYFGNIDGEELISSLGSTWHFIQYESVFGYVYTGHGIVDNIPPNIIEIVPPPLDLTPNETQNQHLLFALMLAIPATITTLALFSRQKSRKTE